MSNRVSDKVSYADLAAESQSHKKLQFGGFYSVSNIQAQQEKDNQDNQSLKGEAEDNFDFPLQLDFLNSLGDRPLGADATPCFAPKSQLEKIVEREESSNTGGDISSLF